MRETLFGMDPAFLGYLAGSVLFALVSGWCAKKRGKRDE